MTCIFEVTYEVQWDSSDARKWETQAVKVLAGADAIAAVAKAKAAALSQRRLDDNGVEHQCVSFRLRGVALVAEAEL